MAVSLELLAQIVGGQVVGAGETRIERAATLHDAGPDAITFIDHPDKLLRLTGSQAGAVVVPQGVVVDRPAIQVADPHAAFTAIVLHFRPARAQSPIGIDPRAILHPTARVAPDAEIHPGAVIGEGVEIGSGCVVHSGAVLLAGCRLAEQVTIYPNAVLYEETLVGPRSIIHACAVLGAAGFGYSLSQGRHVRSAQLGWVEIGADVEIGPGTTIDRGTYGPTRIGDGTKIDDQVMIAHNCRIGRHNILCSQVGIAGSASTGDYVVLAGQVGIRDHVHIGDQAVLGAQAGVMNDVPAGGKYLGAPAAPEREYMSMLINQGKLSEMRKEMRRLQRQVEELVRRVPPSDSQAA